MTTERASLFSAVAWTNRAVALVINVPALVYVAIRFPREFRGYAKRVGIVLLTGRGGL